MKIAIAIVDKNKNSKVSSRGGRAPYYLIFDKNTGESKIISNPFSMGGGGVGPSVAKMLSDMEVNIFVAGAVGEKMAEALDERSVKYDEMEGDVNEVLTHF